MTKKSYWFIILFGIFMPVLAFADVNLLDSVGVPALRIHTDDAGQSTYSLSVQILFLMTAMTLLPALILTMTSFTRVIIVLGILRQAMGMPQTPSNQILIGLALFMTLFIMMPILAEINEQSIEPYMAEKISLNEAFDNAQVPIRHFMERQTRTADLELFKELAKEENSETAVPFRVLLPAFVTSEIKTAFQIGFLLFIPFLIIDLVVASVLMAMGMMMLSPLIISLPFKIMLFVLVDGWTLVVGALASSFGG